MRVNNVAILFFGTIIAMTITKASFCEDVAANSDAQIRILQKSKLHMDGKTRVWIREHTYQPEWKAPTHEHSSDLYLYIVSGAFELITEEDGLVVYTAGQSLRMRPGLVMDARNPSSSEQLKIAVFQVGNVDEPFVVPIDR